jgi:cytochrome P450
MDAPARRPVADWAADFDIFDVAYVEDPVPIWADLRQRCPIAHSTRWGGSWMPTRYADVVACARLVPALSNSQPLVVPPIQVVDEATGELVSHHTHAPPISLDPPDHGPVRHLLLPSLAPDAVARHEPFTRQLAHRFVDRVAPLGRCDAAVDYAQQIPPRVIARFLGIDQGTCGSAGGPSVDVAGLHRRHRQPDPPGGAGQPDLPGGGTDLEAQDQSCLLSRRALRCSPRTDSGSCGT